MDAVRGKQDENHKIRNQQGQIEGVGVIKILESPIEKMLANVLPESAREHKNG